MVVNLLTDNRGNGVFDFILSVPANGAQSALSGVVRSFSRVTRTGKDRAVLSYGAWLAFFSPLSGGERQVAA